MDDSAIILDEIIETCNEETNFNQKEASCKTRNFYILLGFLLIIIALLIAVNISSKAKTFITILIHKQEKR